MAIVVAVTSLVGSLALPTSCLAASSTAVDMAIPAAYFSGNSGVVGETRKTGGRDEHG